MTLAHPLQRYTPLLCVLLIAGCAAKRRPVANAPSATTQPAPGEPPPEKPAPETNANAAPAHAPAKHPKTPPTPAPVGYTEEGSASWYGNPFNGRRAANGEIYDMYQLTAAHRTLPFETMVRVTNLNNGKTTAVRITDRGPFVGNRIIDLSLAAARAIESTGPGVVPVRLEVLGNVDVTAGFFTVQVGAFKDRGNADRLKARLSASYSPIFIQPYESPDGSFYRVRVGKVSGEDAARTLADQLRQKESFSQALVFRLDE